MYIKSFLNFIMTDLKVLVMIACIASLPAAAADQITCANKVLVPGDSLGKIRNFCGEPLDKETHTTLQRRLNHHPKSMRLVRMHNWLYDFGTKKRLRLLKFSDGTLIRILTASSRKKDSTDSRHCLQMPKSLKKNDSELLLRYWCGKPDRIVSTSIKYEPIGDGWEQQLKYQNWVYDFPELKRRSYARIVNARLLAITSTTIDPQERKAEKKATRRSP